MNPSTSHGYDTFATYQAERELQDQALDTYKRLEALADHGVSKAEKLLTPAWVRYNRRTYRVNLAADQHWGAL